MAFKLFSRGFTNSFTNFSSAFHCVGLMAEFHLLKSWLLLKSRSDSLFCSPFKFCSTDDDELDRGRHFQDFGRQACYSVSAHALPKMTNCHCNENPF